MITNYDKFDKKKKIKTIFYLSNYLSLFLIKLFDNIIEYLKMY
jgi:hypothetical protein